MTIHWTSLSGFRIAAVAALLFSPSMALAQSNEAILKYLAERLEDSGRNAADASKQPQANVSRSGTFRITASFKKTTSFSLPVACIGEVSYFDLSGSPSMSKSAMKRLTFSGNKANCSIEFNYKWAVKSEGIVFVGLQVMTEELAVKAANSTSMWMQWNIPSAVPTKNGLTVFPFGEKIL